jgi:hypothetical protein
MIMRGCPRAARSGTRASGEPRAPKTGVSPAHLTLGSHRDRRPGHSPDRLVCGTDRPHHRLARLYPVRPGQRPEVTDAELACLAVAQVLLRYDDERHWLRAAPARVGHLFPRLLRQSPQRRECPALLPELAAATRRGHHLDAEKPARPGTLRRPGARRRVAITDVVQTVSGTDPRPGQLPDRPGHAGPGPRRRPGLAWPGPSAAPSWPYCTSRAAPALPGVEDYGGSVPPQTGRSAARPARVRALAVHGRADRDVPVFTAIRSAKEEPSSIPAASPRLPHGSPSPWRPGRTSTSPPRSSPTRLSGSGTHRSRPPIRQI